MFDDLFEYESLGCAVKTNRITPRFKRYCDRLFESARSLQEQQERSRLFYDAKRHNHSVYREYLNWMKDNHRLEVSDSLVSKSWTHLRQVDCEFNQISRKS